MRRPLALVLLSLAASVACSSSDDDTLAAGAALGGPVADALDDEGWQRLAKEHGYELRLSELPLKGGLPDGRVPWADTNWPGVRGTIAWRWNDPAFANELLDTDEWPPLPYTPPSEAEVRAMPREELAKLSPAEKYDVFMGFFDYPTVNNMVEDADPSTEWWAGICGGWSSAALQYPEPSPRDVIGPSGISVPFGSSDIKALMALYHEVGYIPAALGVEHLFDLGEVFKEATELHKELAISVGDECGGGECAHPTAAEFHLLLANELGRLGNGFTVDVRADERTYFQPAFAYESTILKEATTTQDGAPARSLRFRTVLTTASDIEDVRADQSAGTMPRWEPRLSKGENVVASHVYEYEIVVSADSRVLASAWVSTDRPDSVFMRRVPAGFGGHLRGLEPILAAE